MHFLDIHHGDRDAVGVRFIFPVRKMRFSTISRSRNGNRGGRQLRISSVLRPAAMLAPFGATMESASIGVGPVKKWA